MYQQRGRNRGWEADGGGGERKRGGGLDGVAVVAIKHFPPATNLS